MKKVEKLIDKNNQVGTNIKQVNNTIEKLSIDVSDIKSILGIINSISEQTNLLALNASIEAARAGDHGRGFAVVADQIRKLARQSKQSTEQIDNVINTILRQTNSSVDVVKTSMGLFEEQTKSISDTKDSFQNILKGTDLVFIEIRKFDDSINTINNTKEIVIEAISDLVSTAELTSSTSEEITATTEEQAAAAEELGNLAENLNQTINDLQNLIDKFKV